MGKTRDLVKKIRDTKGTFHANMGSIKDRNGLDLTEADYIKKRWQQPLDFRLMGSERKLKDFGTGEFAGCLIFTFCALSLAH